MFTDDYKVTTVAPVATGTTTITGTALDMTGWDGVAFIVRLGSPATNNNLRVQQSATSGGSYSDIAGTLRGNHATNTPLIMDIFKPTKPFLKYQVTRGTTSTIDIVTIVQYKASGVQPVTQPSGTDSAKLLEPIEGTA